MDIRKGLALSSKHYDGVVVPTTAAESIWENIQLLQEFNVVSFYFEICLLNFYIFAQNDSAAVNGTATLS